jgi:hypothetical protein
VKGAPRERLDPRLLVVPALCAVALYARFFDGFWLGDDFANLHHAWVAGREGTAWRVALAQFFTGVASEGAFYRPLMIASLLANEAIAGAHYAGWFAVNLAVHVANVVLVGVLAMRLAAACGSDGRASGVVAAVFFALCPLLAEGVFWVSARADACVTLLTLGGVYLWSTSARPAGQALFLPLLLVPALAFKESAAVFPMQMLLVALAWPGRPTRAQIAAIVACFVLVAAYFALRAQLFGDVWQVYPPTGEGPLAERVQTALRSIVPWWRALTRDARHAADAEVALAVIAALLLAASVAGARARLALALLGASAGLVAATLLDLGSLADTGKSGRLAYSPVAWLALALGVAGARAYRAGDAHEPRRSRRRAGVALAALSALAGTWVLEAVLARAYAAERAMETVAAAIAQWTSEHPGLTLLVIPEQFGAVVAGRNAQGGLVMPPVQAQPLLDRVLPTLPREIPERYSQLAAGLATRLQALHPTRVDAPTLAQLFVPAAPRWPEHYACASASGRLVAVTPPDARERDAWIDDLLRAASRCEAQP